MKTILAATDFSPCASNSVEYAAELAHVMQAKLILFHACHVPLIGTEIPVEIATMDDVEKKGLEELSGIAARLQQRYSNLLDIECVCKCGFAVDEINQQAHTEKADMIIMGMHGAGFLSEKLLGSITTSVLSDATCPVMVINDKVSFHTIKKIVLACDVENDSLYLPEPLRKLALFFKAHIFVLDVVPAAVTVPSELGEIRDLGNFIRQFSGISHSFHFWKGENPVSGINDFVAEEKMDLVVMMPHQRPFLSRLFHSSNTKHMAFHSQVPLLVLKDSENNIK